MEKKVFHFEYDIATKKLTDVSDQEEKKDFPRWANIAPDSSYVVYAKGYNLWYMDMENLRKAMEDEKDSTIVEYALTTDGTKDVPYGGNSYSGIDDRDTNKRYSAWGQWSPDAKHFIMEKYDMSNIGELWVINSTAEPRPKARRARSQELPDALRHAGQVFQSPQRVGLQGPDRGRSPQALHHPRPLR